VAYNPLQSYVGNVCRLCIMHKSRNTYRLIPSPTILYAPSRPVAYNPIRTVSSRRLQSYTYRLITSPTILYVPPHPVVHLLLGSGDEMWQGRMAWPLHKGRWRVWPPRVAGGTLPCTLGNTWRSEGWWCRSSFTPTRRNPRSPLWSTVGVQYEYSRSTVGVQ
jgi:hypothetical protein